MNKPNKGDKRLPSWKLQDTEEDAGKEANVRL